MSKEQPYSWTESLDLVVSVETDDEFLDVQINKDTLIAALVGNENGYRFFMHQIVGKLRDRHKPPNFGKHIRKAGDARDMISNIMSNPQMAGLQYSEMMLPDAVKAAEQKLPPTKFVTVHMLPVGRKDG